MKNDKNAQGSISVHGNFRGVPDKPKDFWKTVLRLIGYIKPFAFVMTVAVLCAVISVGFTVYNPKLLGTITTDLFEWIKNPTGGFNMAGVYKTVVILISLYVLSGIFSYFENYIMAGVAQKIVFRLRKDMDDKITKLPMSYIDANRLGDILSRIVNDVDAISGSLQQSLLQIIKAIVTIVAIVIIMLNTNIVMTVVTVVMLPISFAITYTVTKKSQKYFTANQQVLGRYNGHIEETYSGNLVIKAFSHEEKSKAEFDKINDELTKHGFNSVFYSGMIMPLLHIFNNLNYIVLAIVGSVLAINGSLSVGNIQAFIHYSKQFSMPINQVANMSSIIQSTIACAERVFEFLDAEEEQDICEAQIVNPFGDVEFNRVNFAYEEGSAVLKDVTFTANRGQSIAIVGHTGAGKTTLVNLLMRFYPITSGRITVDGVDISKVSLSNLHDIFGMVLQDTWLFQGSIYDNIAYGKDGATREEVIEATKLARADYFINTMEKGYDTLVAEDGENLSGGQRQLITIARAILKNPKILILDEATSSVDTRTELLIQEGMKELMKDKTSFIVAHRLSTVKDSSCIVVMDNGQIVETGTHAELLKQNGFYGKLYNSQF